MSRRGRLARNAASVIEVQVSQETVASSSSASESSVGANGPVERLAEIMIDFIKATAGNNKTVNYSARSDVVPIFDPEH